MQLYGFTARDVDRIHALLAAYEQGRIRQDAPRHIPHTTQADTYLVQTSVSIAAGAVGTGELVDLDYGSPPAQTVVASITVPVYNPLSSALPAGTYLVTREPSAGYYVYAGNLASSLSNSATSTSSSSALTAGAWATYAFITLSIPSAGTYLLFATISVSVQKPNSGLASVEAVLYDTTNAVQIGPAFQCGGFNNNQAGTNNYGTYSSGSIVWPNVFSGAVSLGFQTFFSDGGGGGSAAVLGTSGSGKSITSLGYLKIA